MKKSQIKNPVLDKIKFNKNKGELTYNGIRYLLLRPETLVSAQKKNFFDGGFEGGSRSANFLKNKGLSPKQIVQDMCKWGTYLGWGNMRLKSFSRKSLTVEVKSSPFANAYGMSRKSVCELLRGVVSGIAFVISIKKFVAKELKCLSKGDTSCIFKVELK